MAVQSSSLRQLLGLHTGELGTAAVTAYPDVFFKLQCSLLNAVQFCNDQIYYLLQAILFKAKHNDIITFFIIKTVPHFHTNSFLNTGQSQIIFCASHAETDNCDEQGGDVVM